MEEWQALSNEGRRRLQELAESLWGIEVWESTLLQTGQYVPNLIASPRDTTLSDALKKYAERSDLVGRKVSIRNYLLLPHVELRKSPRGDYMESLFISSKGYIWARSSLWEGTYILMKSPRGDIYYAKIREEREKLIAETRPSGVTIEEGSEILAVIQPRAERAEVIVITTQEYLQSKRNKIPELEL